MPAPDRSPHCCLWLFASMGMVLVACANTSADPGAGDSLGPGTSHDPPAGPGLDGSGGRVGTGGDPGAGGSQGAGRGPDEGETGGQGSGQGSDPGPSTGSFPPVDDFLAAGPFPTVVEGTTGPGGTYTVYRPEVLGDEGRLHPIVAWTSGGSTHHSGYTLLPHLASHGFVVISSETVPNIGQEAALGQEMLSAIGWLLAQNDDAAGPYHGKLNPQRVAASGYSMGSLATFTIADDPRLTTTLHISGGNMAPENVHNLRQPAAFICGLPGDAACNLLSADCDIAGVNCASDFDNATTPVFYATFSGGHLGILQSPQRESIGAMSTAWLRYRLMDDTTLAGMFRGADCEYCNDAEWAVQQKQMD